MKPYYFVCLCLLASCNNNVPVDVETNTEITTVFEEHDYSELESQKIAWKDIFRQKQNRYFCYIYSERCGHCKDIKNEVIEYGLGHSAFYIIEYDKSIPLMNDISTTIGMTNVEYVGILGTPTLLSIISQTLIENIAGSNKVIEKLRNS